MRYLRWLPTAVLMVIIFTLSATPSQDLPNFGLWDFIVKKGAHMLGYALLAVSIWYAEGFNRHRGWLALGLAVIYALTDEFHQSFVPGRHPSVVDALGFDGVGAGIGLLVSWSVKKKEVRRSDPPHFCDHKYSIGPDLIEPAATPSEVRPLSLAAVVSAPGNQG
jgi:VanZ family protein